MLVTRRTLMAASAAGAVLTAAGCGQRGDAAVELNTLLDRLSADILREAPEFASSLGVTEEQAGGRFVDRIADYSREGFIRQRDIAQRTIADLERIDRDRLEGQNQVSYDVVLTSLRDQVAAQQFEFGGGAQGP